jgi:seryl-tRNA synthetase
VTDDEGNPGVFEYRVAAVVPGQRSGGERIVICDSEKQTTGPDGAVSFECAIPTIEELESMGVENAAERAVIPVKGGIAVRDPATNETEKEHGKALIVNTQKIQNKLEAALGRIDSFIAKSQELVERCDNITARAEEAGAENFVERCASFQEKIQEKIDDALQAQERINSALVGLGNLTSIDFEELRDGLLNFRDGARDFRVEVGDLREFAIKARADLEKRVAKEIAERTKERAKELREQIREREESLKERIRELRSARIDRPGSDSGESESVSDETESEEVSESAEPENSGSSGIVTSESSNSGSGSSESGESSGSENSGSGRGK